MPVPKRRIFRSRRRNRRAHDKIHAQGLSVCPKCHEPKLPHRACTHCGEYNGRKVINVEA